MDGREHDGHLADALENKTKKHYYCHSFIHKNLFKMVNDELEKDFNGEAVQFLSGIFEVTWADWTS